MPLSYLPSSPLPCCNYVMPSPVLLWNLHLAPPRQNPLPYSPGLSLPAHSAFAPSVPPHSR